MRGRWLVAGWAACIIGIVLLPGIYTTVKGAPPLSILILGGLTLTFGVGVAPFTLAGLFWVPISLWTGSSLDWEVCCTQSQGGHAENMFGLMLGAPIAILIYVIAAQLLLRRSASPGVSLVLTAVLFAGWMTLVGRADAYALHELCPPICAKGA